MLGRVTWNTVPKLERAIGDAAPVSPPASDPLKELGRRALAGDTDAIRALVRTVGPPMLRAIRKIAGVPPQEVEDVLQESVEGLLEALRSFRGESSLMHFACRVAVLTAMNARRRSAVREQLSLDGPNAPPTPASGTPSPADELLANFGSLRLHHEELRVEFRNIA